MNWREFFFPPRKSARWLIRGFGPRISIRLDTAMGTFASAHKSLAVPAVVHVGADDRIIAIGAPPTSSDAFVSVRLFDPAAGEQRQRMLLEKFLQYGLQSVLGKGISVRPFVTVVLRVPVPPSVIEAMLLRAGAGEVTFGPSSESGV